MLDEKMRECMRRTGIAVQWANESMAKREMAFATQLNLELERRRVARPKIILPGNVPKFSMN